MSALIRTMMAPTGVRLFGFALFGSALPVSGLVLPSGMGLNLTACSM